MSILKRSDVKNHLHAPFFPNAHVRQPDATAFSAAEPAAIKVAPSLLFAEDFIEEHSSSSVFAASTGPVTGAPAPQPLPASKSAKA